MNRRLGVFASGRGSNFESILRAIQAGDLDAEVAVLISDKENAPALETARSNGIPAVYHPYDRHDRETFERAADATLREHNVELVILAGFMRLITPFLIEAWRGSMLNIHPSLLPAFKGVNAQQQAFDYGVKVTGCTVHEVSEEMDAGRIVAQTALEILPTDTAETLSARILEQEHLLYPKAVATFLTGMA